jgi:exodeoxyribonuclease V alpha subunit
LPHSFILVDEASMLDTDIMFSLLAARAPGTHIIFVGDTNQLPPVGHGAPLRDFIMAGVPHGQLTEIQRNSGQIVKTCAEIVEKRRFTASDRIDVEEGKNLKVSAFHTPESQIEYLLDSLPILERRWGVDPVWGCQVLVAVNANSPLARKGLNMTLQELLNPNGKQVKESPFRRGDKIICTKNKEFPALDANGGETHFVANGEMGEVIEVEEKRTMVRLTSPDRMIIVPRGTNDDADDGEESTGTGCDWELGYAISAHKSQGSEWPIVFVMLDEYSGARMVMSRQWLYTAISRAKLFCVCIGKKSVADACCQRDSLFKRKTFLRELILEPQLAVFDDLFTEAV